MTEAGAAAEGGGQDDGDDLWGTGEGEALAVIATGLGAVAGLTFVQVLWLFLVIALGLMMRFVSPPTEDHGDRGGGGGVPTAPRPSQPNGTNGDKQDRGSAPDRLPHPATTRCPATPPKPSMPLDRLPPAAPPAGDRAHRTDINEMGPTCPDWVWRSPPSPIRRWRAVVSGTGRCWGGHQVGARGQPGPGPPGGIAAGFCGCVMVAYSTKITTAAGRTRRTRQRHPTGAGPQHAQEGVIVEAPEAERSVSAGLPW